MDIHSVNLIAVLIAAILDFGIGFLWYSPQGLGETWAEASGKNLKDMQPTQQQFAAAAGLSLVKAFALTALVASIQATTMVEGIEIGFMVWLGFMATGIAGAVIWCDKPQKVGLIDAGCSLVSLVISGAFLGLWY